MASDLATLKANAAELTEAERADLALALIESLDDPIEDPGEVKKAWAIEIQRRVAEIDAGVAELIPGDQVFAEIRKKLRA